MKFRDLTADDVECRVAQVKDNGLSLLLYKNARCDMNILDETVGVLNWQRHHTRENANCIVSIWDEEKKQWIEKEDTGTESNTEQEKGLASDSFKRACFNLGIGRELYTAPFIWITEKDCTIRKGANGRASCYDRFKVTQMTVVNKRITSLEVVNASRKGLPVVFTWDKAPAKKPDNMAEALAWWESMDNTQRAKWSTAFNYQKPSNMEIQRMYEYYLEKNPNKEKKA